MSRTDSSVSIGLSIMASALLFASASALTKTFEFAIKEYLPFGDELTAWIAYTIFITLVAFVVVYYALRAGDPLLQ